MDPSPTVNPAEQATVLPATSLELGNLHAEVRALRAELAPLVAMFHQLQQARGRLGKAVRGE